jgi:large subunit ribosomal protein L24
MKVKKGDTIKMLTGKDRGKTGKVLHSFPAIEKVMVEGLNILKKHARPKREGEKGQRLEIPRKVSVSNVEVVCPKCARGTRVSYRIENGRKFRICKKCQAEI